MFVCALIFLTCTCACKLSKFLRTLLLILFPVFPCEGTLAGAVDTPSAFIFTTFRMRRSSTYGLCSVDFACIAAHGQFCNYVYFTNRAWRQGYLLSPLSPSLPRFESERHTPRANRLLTSNLARVFHQCLERQLQEGPLAGPLAWFVSRRSFYVCLLAPVAPCMCIGAACLLTIFDLGILSSFCSSFL